jgi:hypothetical protein
MISKIIFFVKENLKEILIFLAIFLSMSLSFSIGYIIGKLNQPNYLEIEYPIINEK